MYFDQMKTFFENWKISAEILEIQKLDFDKNFMFPAKNADVFKIQENARFLRKFSFYAIFEQKLHFMKKWF